MMDYYTVTQVAEMLDRTEGAIRKAIRTNNLPAEKFAGRYVITKEGLEQYLMKKSGGDQE